MTYIKTCFVYFLENTGHPIDVLNIGHPRCPISIQKVIENKDFLKIPFCNLFRGGVAVASVSKSKNKELE